MSEQLLTAAQAAARLGVKRETIYAYVSRGLLDRTLDTDGRTSRFEPGQVDALRRQRRRSAEGEVGSIISSAITRVAEDGPTYRGRPVIELVRADLDFEAIAELLWSPGGAESDHDVPLSADYPAWTVPPELGAAIHDLQQALPTSTSLLDRYRMAVSFASAADPLRHNLSDAAVAAAGRRMLAAFVAGLHKLHLGPRDRLADQLWTALTDEPGTAAQRRCLNAALVLLADHGLAASTFAVRIAASVRADPYSLVITGLGPMGGVLHGAASAGVHRLLDQGERDGIEVAVGRVLAAGQRLPGVGHSVYRDRDPRHDILAELIAEAWEEDPRLDSVSALRRLAVDRGDGAANIDLAVGSLTWLAGMGPDAGEFFAIARTAGWLAHAMEEHTEHPLRFRPTARYTGP